MERMEVDSSLIAWVAYFEYQQRLQLGFRSGEVYDYFDVPHDTYHGLLESESKGRHFNRHIRPFYRTESLKGRPAT